MKVTKPLTHEIHQSLSTSVNTKTVLKVDGGGEGGQGHGVGEELCFMASF